MNKKYLFVMIMALLFASFYVGVVFAQQSQPTPSDDQVNSIARQLYCPVCENTPLDVCPTTACAQWRDLIRQKLAAGWSETAIKEYFVNQYGARVLGTPPAKGLNLLVYIIPPLAILVGVYVLVLAYRSWKHNASQVEPLQSADPSANGTSEVRDAYVKRLEDEVRKK
jgi:cytochrome c-type biogenesis protein CcmH